MHLIHSVAVGGQRGLDGDALIAHGVIDRATEDVDLFIHLGGQAAVVVPVFYFLRLRLWNRPPARRSRRTPK